MNLEILKKNLLKVIWKIKKVILLKNFLGNQNNSMNKINNSRDSFNNIKENKEFLVDKNNRIKFKHWI